MNREDLSVYFIMGTTNCIEDPLEVLEDALKAGVTIFQLREKGDGSLKGSAYEEFARQCQLLCNEYNVPFIVNDDVELALKLQADGVHVGQDDQKLEEIRKQFVGKIVGVSVHNEQEMDTAVFNGADYVGIGPIHETKSKTDAKPAAGVTFLAKARKKYPAFPIVAIGGLTTDNAFEVFEAGADGVAVISAICESPNRKETVRSFMQAQI
ncbi:thiamine phosphate synthase [Lysinibacillus sp. BW-2-10]|uniref:thiamine phosphate synthase n=1 Tax=Lysinibacillus sp. BW-2-10 TaxID=2590030 RepID=UPI00117C3588|nr:thiamine phosphate synthase [Lysinibacillus sp. BW-2-10]TSI05206.1 thiamine phosphate synthase [Lysinibacillus sp. BW-2-10]